MRRAQFGVFLEAAMLLIVARIIVAVVPFSKWKQQVMLSPEAEQEDASVTEQQRQAALHVMRGIAQVDRNLPDQFICLPQAIAARWMLSRRNVPTRLYIGTIVDPGEGRVFHAWLKVGDLMVTGACKEEDYAIFGSQYRV